MTPAPAAVRMMLAVIRAARYAVLLLVIMLSFIVVQPALLSIRSCQVRGTDFDNFVRIKFLG